MDCAEIREKLSATLDDALSRSEESIVRKHLTSCENCEVYLEELKKGRALLNNLGPVEPPQWLTQKIMARVNERAERQGLSVLSRLFRPLMVKVPLQAIALVLIVGLTVSLYRANSPQYRELQVPEPAKSEGSAESPGAALPDGPKTGSIDQTVQPPTREGQQTGSPPQDAKATSAAPPKEPDRPAPPSQPDRFKLPVAAKEKVEHPSSSLEMKEAPDHGGSPAVGRTESLEEPEQYGRGRARDMKGSQSTTAPTPVLRKSQAAPPSFKLVVKAEDVEVTTRRIEDLLNKAGTKTLARTSRPGASVITFEIKTDGAEGVVAELKAGFGATVSSRMETGGRSVILTIEVTTP